MAGQIHGGSDEISVFRLEGSKLYITDGDQKHRLVTENYVLGTRFQAKFEVSDGKIRAYYNGVLQATLWKSFSTGYFKAGAYTQANCENSAPCNESNFGEVKIYRLTVPHDGNEQPGGPGRTVPVADAAQLQSAFGAARPGDRIVWRTASTRSGR